MSQTATWRVSLDCLEHGAEFRVEIEHDHGDSYYGQTEQLWAARIIHKHCDCCDAVLEDQAISWQQEA